MIAAVADTHAIIWYLYDDVRLSTNVRRFIEATAMRGEQIALASIALVEMIYLIEKGRIPAESFSTVASELISRESLFTEIPLDLGVARALARVSSAEVPDMPDRIIAATALHLKVPLISRDRRIILSSVHTIW